MCLRSTDESVVVSASAGGAGGSRSSSKSIASPLEWMSARSITFSSSRTLPGHACACSRCIRVAGTCVIRASHRLLPLLNVGPYELGNVFGMLAKRRQSDGKHAQPIVQIRAKLSCGNPGLEMTMRRSDDADVDLSRARGAHALELPVLQDTQQFRLKLQREVADLVQEDRPAVCQFEPALPIGRRAGKCTALVTEELAFDECRRERGAVDAHEVVPLPPAVCVNGPREQFFARSRFAEQQDRAVGWRNLLQASQCDVQRQTGADDIVKAARGCRRLRFRLADGGRRRAVL